jgi:hypothetical protein
MSMHDTEFWGNIVARPNGRGYQIAYGHHRLEVLKKRMRWDTVPVIVKKLSNEQMLKMMSRENHDAYGTDAWVEMEDIRQTIWAYDRGEIELPKIDRRGAEIFLSPRSEKEFTKIQIARFHGRTKQDGKDCNYGFEEAWKALDLIEHDILSTEQFKGLSREDMAVIAGRAKAARNVYDKEANKVEKKAKKADDDAEKKRLEKEAEKLRTKGEKEAKSVAKKAEKKIRDGEGVRAAREVPITTIAPEEKIVDVNGLAKILAGKIKKTLTGDDFKEQMSLLRKHKKEASERMLQMVCNELDGLAKRVATIRKGLR